MGQRAEPLLRASQLSYSLGTLPLIQQVSLEIDPGEVVGLAGQSGAGKSALALLLAGLYTPTAGELYFDGRRVTWPFRRAPWGSRLSTSSRRWPRVWTSPATSFWATSSVGRS